MFYSNVPISVSASIFAFVIERTFDISKHFVKKIPIAKVEPIRAFLSITNVHFYCLVPFCLQLLIRVFVLAPILKLFSTGGGVIRGRLQAFYY